MTTEESKGKVVEFRKDETEYILSEMFKVVGVEYTPEFVLEPDWYMKYTWTPEQAAKFTTWLAEYLKRRHKGVGKKKSTSEAQWFVLNVGWLLSNSETSEASLAN
jgi:hypothetical protein